MTEIEKKVSNLPNVEHLAVNAQSKVTPVLEQISTKVAEAKRVVIKTKTRVHSIIDTILRDITSTSTELKAQLKDFMEKKFEEMMKSVCTVTQSTSNISSGITTLTIEQQAIMEQLTKFLKDDFPKLLSKTVEDLGVDFQICLHTMDKTIGNWQDVFTIDL